MNPKFDMIRKSIGSHQISIGELSFIIQSWRIKKGW